MFSSKLVDDLIARNVNENRRGVGNPEVTQRIGFVFSSCDFVDRSVLCRKQGRSTKSHESTRNSSTVLLLNKTESEILYPLIFRTTGIARIERSKLRRGGAVALHLAAKSFQKSARGNKKFVSNNPIVRRHAADAHQRGHANSHARNSPR